jgi:hypothetical protein
MTPTKATKAPSTPTAAPSTPALEYLVDAAQRTVLFWDVMRVRVNAYREQLA